MCSSNRLSQRRAYVDDAQLAATLYLVTERDSVGDHDLTQTALIKNVDRIAAQDTVGNNGYDLGSTVVLDRLRSLGEGSAGIRHIVDQDRDLVYNVSDEDHAPDDVGSRAFLVNESKASV